MTEHAGFSDVSRIAITSALKLEREHDLHNTLVDFLDHLQALASNHRNPAAHWLKAVSRMQDAKRRWPDGHGSMSVRQRGRRRGT